MVGKEQEISFDFRRFSPSDMESGVGNHKAGITESELGEDEMFVHLPFSDFRTWIFDNETVFKAYEAFPIHRLSRVKQLSNLAYVGPNPDTQYLYGFTHTRAEHSLVTAKIGEAIFRNNGAPEELVEKAGIIFVAHDMATPALGDATKKLDKKNLDEEDNWQRVMTPKVWSFLEKQGITKEEMDDTLHNKGLLGEVLDIADRISYVMKDLSQLTTTPILDLEGPNLHDKGYRRNLGIILAEDQLVGNIYKEVGINFQSNQVYFKDPERLGRFLEIRALLTKNLYMHPVSQARDLLVTDYLRPYYTTDENAPANILTPDSLRGMEDDGLIDFLSDKHPELIDSIYIGLGKSVAFNLHFAHWYPQFYPEFDTRKDLETRKKELEETCNFLIRGQVESKGFKTATELKVVNSNGGLTSFKDYDTKTAQRIEGYSDATKKFYLFYEKLGRIIDPE